MSEEKDIDKIKDIFNGLDKTAPGELWSKLSDQLGHDTHGQQIEQKIKNGFESLDGSAPPKIWNSVNHQLNIDKVWERINKELDRNSLFNWRYAAALALLFVLACFSGYYYYIQDNERIAGRIESGNKERIDPAQLIPAGKISSTEHISLGSAPEAEYKLPSASVTNEHQAKQNQVHKARPKQSRHVFSQRPKPAPGNSIRYRPRLEHRNPLNTLAGKEAAPGAYIFQGAEPEQHQAFSAPERLPLIGLDLATAAPTADSAIKKTLQPETYSFPALFTRFEFGLTYSFNNTWILNNETQRSFDPNSLISTSPVFASSYGFLLNYNLSPKHAISAEYYIFSKSHQQYSEFIDGRYYTHALEFNYTKLTLLYQFNMPAPGLHRVPTKLTFKAGLYTSYLWNYSHTYSSDITTATGSYKRYDYGVKIAFGQEKQFGNFMIGYGLNAEYGFNNNFAGSSEMPADFNVTKNALVGVFLNLKYRR